MSMNIDPNNDPKQSIVSKLGRVHSAHTQGPGSAMSLCAVSQCLSAVSPRALSCRVTTPPTATQKLYRDIKTHVARAARRVAHAYPCTPSPTSQALCHDTILLYRDQSWKMGSSLSSYLSCAFFFSFIFFSFVLLIVKP